MSSGLFEWGRWSWSGRETRFSDENGIDKVRRGEGWRGGIREGIKGYREGKSMGQYHPLIVEGIEMRSREGVCPLTNQERGGESETYRFVSHAVVLVSPIV